MYKAFDLELDRTVALKVIRPELMANPEIVKRFKQELLLASRISHKNVLRIHDLGEGVGVKFISMAFVEGENLAEVLQKQQVLPVEKGVEVGTQICEALIAAHRVGVVHRDLKPENIMLDAAGQVYVSDFGLAKSLEYDEEGATAMTQAGQVLGTPRYMSPEQVQGEELDGRTDIYSFGLILYEMSTGALPFRGNSLQLALGRLQSIPRNPSTLNARLPAYLADTIMRCLEKDRERRYQNFEAVLKDLSSGGFTAAPPVETAQPLSLDTTVQRVPWRWMAVAGIGAVLIVGAASVPVVSHFLPGRQFKSGNVSTTVPQKRLAVLPFHIGNDDAKLAEVALGVNEALNAKFAGVKDLQVASSTAIQKLAADTSVQNAAKELGSNLVVSGDIQSAGDRLQIIVNLDDVEKGQRVLTAEFPGVREDLLTLEDQIYAKLLSKLETKPSADSLARVSLHETENYSAYELYLKGRNAMRGQLDAKNVTAAIDSYEQAVKQDPGFGVAFAGIADADLRMYRLTKQNDWAEKALSAAQQAQAMAENQPEVYFALGSAYIATGKKTEAIATLKKALDLAPNSDDAYRRLGDAFRANGDKDQALAAYNRAIELNPYYWFNYNALGSAYLKFNDNQKALSAFLKVTELDPNNAAGYQNLSIAYFNMGRFEDCVPVLKKSLELDKHPIGYTNLGTVYFYLKRYADAVPMYEEALKLDPASENIAGNLADAYRWAGQTQQANATYEHAIELGLNGLTVNPRDSGLMGRISLYYAKKGDSAHAQQFIRRARGIDPNDSTLMYNEGVIDWIANKPQDALAAVKDALSKGYSLQDLRNDPELAKLEAMPEFAEIVKQLPKSAQ